LARIKHKVEHLQEHGSTFKNYIKKDVPMLENLVSFYQKSNGETKRKILGCIFSEKFVLENKKVAAIKYTTPIQVLLNVKGVLESGKTKKEVENDLFLNLAPLTNERCNYNPMIEYLIFRKAIGQPGYSAGRL
jgi:hypothetical protein